MKTQQELEALLNQYDSCPLECDGLTRVLTTVLQREQIPHTVYIGTITNTGTGDAFSPHWWIALEDGILIDYRARMWLGNREEVPHGIFQASACRITYAGTSIALEPLNDAVFQFLVNDRG